MKLLRHILVIPLVIVVQLFLVAQFTIRPVNLARIPYRRAERAAALEVFTQNRTPESEAAFHEELRLASRHTYAQQLALTCVVLLPILSFEAWLVYSGKKSGDPSKPVA
jgi:hypothetical protein